ncbi:MAG: hypothetical protein R2828_21545 [Saprospiraceae bacterium]
MKTLILILSIPQKSNNPAATSPAATSPAAIPSSSPTALEILRKENWDRAIAKRETHE